MVLRLIALAARGRSANLRDRPAILPCTGLLAILWPARSRSALGAESACGLSGLEPTEVVDETVMIEDLVSSFPSHLRASIEGLLSRPVSTREQLLGELDAYTRRIDDSARRRPDLDVNLAEAILQACRRLLREHWSELSEDQRRLVQVTCDYYVDPEDEAGDLESVSGFDDDAEVLNLVLDALRRPDLKLRV
ncbi:MAG: hypothetical protein ACREL7_01215 [Longimicrobiales bacterium]